VHANPARALSVRVLISVMEGASFAAPALDDALKRAELPARDAGLCTHLVYGTLRYAPVLEAALLPLLRGETPLKTRALMLCATFEKLVLGTPPHAVVNEYVTLARTGFGPPALVNAVLRRIELPGPVRASDTLPGWLQSEYRAAYGNQTERILDGLLQPQPLWLRLTPAGKGSLLDEGSALEAAEGSETVHATEAGYGDVYRVLLHRPLRETEAFDQGWAQPINPASMACVLALGDVDGHEVLDLAGGAGIKAAMLAAAGATVKSVDKAPGKHRAAKNNMRRLGLAAQFVTADLSGPLDLPSCDRVLLDAPCTGSGTLRSHPEIKLRLTPEAVEQAAELQGQMLDTAASLTAPGGVLVYSVCSVTQEEGPEVVGQFLDTHPDFAPEALPDLLVDVVPSGSGVLTVPLGGVDGFFIARLRRSQE
jgi:16S rRNA (cytosine967-C5)-methyltransferase